MDDFKRPNIKDQIETWFTYHAPDKQQQRQYQFIRDAAKNFATVLAHCTPEGPDQMSAMRKLREVVMTANAAIACDGAKREDTQRFTKHEEAEETSFRDVYELEKAEEQEGLFPYPEITKVLEGSKDEKQASWPSKEELSEIEDQQRRELSEVLKKEKKTMKNEPTQDELDERAQETEEDMKAMRGEPIDEENTLEEIKAKSLRGEVLTDEEAEALERDYIDNRG